MFHQNTSERRKNFLKKAWDYMMDNIFSRRLHRHKKKCDDKNLSKSAFFLNTLKKGEEKRHYTTKHGGHKSKTSNTFYEEQNESSSCRSNVV